MNYKLEGAVEITQHHPDIIIALGIFESVCGRVRFMLTAYIHRGAKSCGYEYYKGQNYLVGDDSRSYSRNYKTIFELPKKYNKIAHDLENIIRSNLPKDF